MSEYFMSGRNRNGQNRNRRFVADKYYQLIGACNIVNCCMVIKFFKETACFPSITSIRENIFQLGITLTVISFILRRCL